MQVGAGRTRSVPIDQYHREGQAETDEEEGQDGKIEPSYKPRDRL